MHEINIGIADLGMKEINGKMVYGFKEFWKFDLLKDSFYIKRNSTFINSPGVVEIRAGNFNFKQDNLTREFINAALKTKNGQQFLRDTALLGIILDGPQKHIIHYRRDSLTKYFVYQVGPPYFFHTFISRLDTFSRGQKWELIAPETNLKEDSLASYTAKLFRNGSLPPPPVQKTIKFTPPVEIKSE